MWFVSPLLSFPGNYMMINEAVFYQSNATLAQNINQLFSLRHFTYLILLSQKIFAKCNSTQADTSEEIIWKFATKCLQTKLVCWVVVN